MTNPNVPPSDEVITEQELAQILREKGPESPEANALLIQWMEREERRVDLVEDRAGATIDFNRRCGHLYLAAGWMAQGIENLEAAAEMARQEKRDDLFREIKREIQEKRSA